MLQLNLLPDVKKEFLHAERTRNLVVSVAILVSFIAGGIIIVLALVMGGQMVQKNILTSDIDKSKATIQQEQTSKQLNEYLTTQNQLSQIDNLKSSQPTFSRLFDYLKQLNPADPNGVQLSNVTIAGAGAATGSTAANTIELQGTTATFASLDVYKTTLTSTTISYSVGAKGKVQTTPLFTTVTVNQAGISQNNNNASQVSFTIDVVYDPVAFANTSQNITLTVPQQTTSDASRNAPKDVFNGNSNSANGNSTGNSNSDNSANGSTNNSNNSNSANNSGGQQ